MSLYGAERYSYFSNYSIRSKITQFWLAESCMATVHWHRQNVANLKLQFSGMTFWEFSGIRNELQVVRPQVISTFVERTIKNHTTLALNWYQLEIRECLLFPIGAEQLDFPLRMFYAEIREPVTLIPDPGLLVTTARLVLSLWTAETGKP